MTGLSGETDDPEPAIGSEKVEECGIESTAIKDNLSHESRKNDKDEEILRKVAAFLILWNDSPLHEFMQNSRDDPLHPGMLGWGQSRASAVSNVFFILGLLTPMGASLAADTSLGRYKVLCITFAFYLVGSVLLLVSSFPSSTRFAAPVFLVSLVLIAVGISGVNGLMAAFVGDQYPIQDRPIILVKKGERVIVDRDRTLESIYNIYYWSINMGGLSGLATTELELHIGFWAAYLLPTCALAFSAVILYVGRGRFTVVAAQSTAIPNAARVMCLGARGGFSLDKSKASHLQRMHNRQVPWTDEFVEEVKRALAACRIMFAAWPILWICRGQASNNLVSQAAQMQSSGIPNDIMYNTNPIVIIICMPIVDRFLFPWLRRSGFALTAVTRLVWGFALEALTMAMAAIVQHLIYRSGPCYEYPLDCTASEGGTIPNSASIFLQLPIFALEAFSEILSAPAGYELAFTMAPGSMKSVLQALFSTTGALGSSLSIALSPLYKDPNMVIVYASLSIAMGVVTAMFYSIWGRKIKRTVVEK
ncbi:hypothetical protein N7524_000993 [Penicillium chrysogenum]|nr:hypothetical protein N7524_000993 [Penicillium chrysogenum]